ncbi:MAG: uroporphyrinogen decarboxylase family protein [Victivallaceae bacterium]|nr:uroporphyrinogen decarboxylase family protein [Victivallaceae bacterium]
MNSREIIMANLECSGAPRPGITFGKGMLCDTVTGGPGNPEGYEQKRWIDGEVEYYDDIWGNLWSRMRVGCQAGEIIEPAIKEWSDLDKWQPPAFDMELCAENYRRVFTAHPDKFKVAALSGWVFASSRYLRKMEIYLMDLALYPEEVKRLHELVAGVFRLQIEAAGKAGADAIFFCEDMGAQNGLLMSPAMWRENFEDLYKGLFGLAHGLAMKVMMHSCGKNNEIIEPLLKAGVNCFQFDQPDVYDYQWLKAGLDKYKAALWSPIDIQKVLPTGNKELIHAAANRMFETFRGSLIFKQYGDLPGIGVKEEWNRWGYEHILELCGI